MKKALVILIGCLIVSTYIKGQTEQKCDTANLRTVEQLKSAETCITTAAEYVLSHPLHGNPKLYFEYRAFIIAWMGKTPDFTFTLNEKMMDICSEEENLLLLGVYTTCLAKAAIEKRNDFVPEAIKYFVEYIKNPKNKVEQTSKVKKLISDFQKDNIDKYLK